MPLAPRLSRIGPSQQSNILSFRQPPAHDGHGKIFQALPRRVPACRYNRQILTFCLIFLDIRSGFGSFPFVFCHFVAFHPHTFRMTFHPQHGLPCYIWFFFFKICTPDYNLSSPTGSILDASYLHPPPLHAALINTLNNGDQGVRHHAPSHLKIRRHLTPTSRIYKEIGDGERVSLCKIATEHIERHPNRPFRLAIDVSIWQFQIQAARGKISACWWKIIF